MQQAEIFVTQDESDGSVLLQNIPVGEDLINVRLRALTRRDRKEVMRFTQEDDGEEKIQALLITQFGDREGITSLELQQEKYDLAVQIIGEAVQEYLFQKRYRLVKSSGKGMAKSNIRSKQKDLRAL